jgi:hypothetical protein
VADRSGFRARECQIWTVSAGDQRATYLRTSATRHSPLELAAWRSEGTNKPVKASTTACAT